jgi:hypothetical protein
MFSILTPRAKADEAWVAYYNFDEGQGGTANDASGWGNTGTVYGAQWVEGVKGGALRFDGLDDYVYVPHSSSLDLDDYDMTVEFWMKLGLDWFPDINHENMCIYDKGDAYTSSLIAESGALRYNLAYVPVHETPETVKNNWATNTWFFIAEVYDGVSINIYVNGELDHSEPVSGPIPQSGFNLCIGAHSLRIAQIWFNGVIDDFKIFGYAREAEAIRNAYNSVSPPPAPGEPVAYWKFDEGSGAIASDNSENGNTGSVVGAQWVDGISGKALSFDGLDDYVDVPSSTSLTISGNEVSFELWLKPTITIDSNSPSINFAEKGDEYGFQMNSGDGRIWFVTVLEPGPQTNWQGIQTTTDQWNANTWYYLVGTYDGSLLKVYVNGLCQNSRPLSGNLNLAPYQFVVGCHTFESMNFFNGAIDEVKIYNYARTAEEIQNDYNSVSPPPAAREPVAHWGFDEGQGNIASDASGNGNTGTVYGAQWVDGAKGKALSFDGITNYVYVPNSLSLDISGNEISVEYWVKFPSGWYPGASAESLILFDKGDAYTASMTGSTGRHRFNIPYVPPYPETNKDNWDANVWYHMADVFDGSQIRMYVNGVLEKTETVVGSVSRSGINLAIGSHCWGDSNFFRGYIDDFAIYNYARTAEEIANDYSLGAQPDFEISVSPERQTAQPDSSIQYQVTVASKNGFSSSVSLTATISPLPTHLDFILDPSTVTPPADGQAASTLRVNLYQDTPLKMYTLTITASSGGITKPPYIVKLSVETSLDVPYQSQGYSAWCAPSSLAMVLRYYGELVHSWDYAESNQLPTSGASPLFESRTSLDALAQYIEKNYAPEITKKIGYYDVLGVPTKPLVLLDIQSNLTKGFPVIISLNSLVTRVPPVPNPFGGHAVVAVGFNETGLFVNDPSGALFTNEGFLNLKPGDPKYPSSWCHAYVTWEDIYWFISVWPFPSILAVHGTPKPASNSGSVYVTLRERGIVFCEETDNDLEKDFFYLCLDKGLKWVLNSSQGLQRKIKPDNIIRASCNRLFISLEVSNNLRITRSLALHADLLGSDGSDYPFIPRSVDNLGGFAEEKGVTFGLTDVGGTLKRGIQYRLYFSLFDPSGDLVDCFSSEPFCWGEGTKAELSEKQNHLYLHVYDVQGRHVGLDYTTTRTELGIPGSYYYDDNNGTIMIVLPQIINLAIVVDAKYAEEPVESYNLTVTLSTDIGDYVQAYSGNITVGKSQEFTTNVSAGSLTLISWEYIFKDTRRGTMLKISIDDKYFQFTAPDKDFGVKHDPKMKVFNHFIIICYEDKELRLIANAVDDRIDFCVAVAWNKLTDQRYLLIDKPGFRSSAPNISIEIE